MFKQILSRAKTDSAKQESARSSANKNKIPTFEEFLSKRDYIGAKTILQFSKDYDEIDGTLKKLWLAFCNFHIGDYKNAMEQYENILKIDETNQTLRLNMGVCMFYLGKNFVFLDFCLKNLSLII